MAAMRIPGVRAQLRPLKLLVTDLVAAREAGHGRQAIDILLCDPMGLAVDSAGNVYVSDRDRGLVWMVDHGGIARIFAGTGRRGPALDGRARRVSLSSPEGIAIHPDGSVFIADAANSVVLRVDARGRAVRIAGTGAPGYSGDGGPATAARLDRPSDVRLDSRGNLYIADVRNHRVRMVDTAGVIRTAAGTGAPGLAADGSPATESPLDSPWGIDLDPWDRLWIADSENHRIRVLGPDGILTTVAGTGLPGHSGDGGPGADATLDTPQGLFVTADGYAYIGDEHNHAVRVLGPDGIMRPFMGTGAPGRAPDGAPALTAALNDPESILVRPDGSVLITDGDNGRVIVVTPDGLTRNFAGRPDDGTCQRRPAA
jgi:DNA-binding beta-propeller fold protein YncE